MSDPKAARFPWGLTVASLFALGLLVSLGGWQVQRLQWKQDLIARAEAAADLPPVSLEALAQMPDPEFRTAVLACDFQNQPYVELQSIQDGQPGVRLISSCDGWLVDLGFVPEAVSARPAQLPAAIPPSPPRPAGWRRPAPLPRRRRATASTRATPGP